MSKIRFSPKETKQEQRTREHINQRVLNNMNMTKETISIEEEEFYKNNPTGSTHTLANNKRLIGEAINALTNSGKVVIYYSVNEEAYDLIVTEDSPIGLLTGLMENTLIKAIGTV
jgi:hypothetical protein